MKNKQANNPPQHPKRKQKALKRTKSSKKEQNPDPDLLFQKAPRKIRSESGKVRHCPLAKGKGTREKL